MIQLKKLIVSILLVIGLYGCLKEVLEIKIGRTYTIEEQVQIEMIKTHATSEITPANKNISYSNIKAKENYIFVDSLLKVTQLSDQQNKLSELFVGEYKINNQTYPLEMILETENYNQLTSTDTIKPNQERYVHLYCEIPKEEMKNEMLLDLNIMQKQEYKYIFTVDEKVVQTNNYQSLGDVIALNKSQLILNQMAQSKKIEPTHKGLFYSYIPIDNDDETFVYLQIDVNNISKQRISLEDYLYCEYKIKDKTYPSKMIMETENHKKLETVGYIESLQTRTVYLAVPIKDSLLKEKGVFEIFVEGQTYQIEGSF